MSKQSSCICWHHTWYGKGWFPWGGKTLWCLTLITHHYLHTDRGTLMLTIPSCISTACGFGRLCLNQVKIQPSRPLEARLYTVPPVLNLILSRLNACINLLCHCMERFLYIRTSLSWCLHVMHAIMLRKCLCFFPGDLTPSTWWHQVQFAAYQGKHRTVGFNVAASFHHPQWNVFKAWAVCDIIHQQGPDRVAVIWLGYGPRSIYIAVRQKKDSNLCELLWNLNEDICFSTKSPKYMVFILYDYCLPLSPITVLCVEAVSCATYINVINKPTGSGNRHLSNKIMTLHYDNNEQVFLWGLQLSHVSFISLMGFVVKETLTEVLLRVLWLPLVSIIPSMLHPSSSITLLLPEKIYVGKL